jgi:hypothetical protein
VPLIERSVDASTVDGAFELTVGGRTDKGWKARTLPLGLSAARGRAGDPQFGNSGPARKRMLSARTAMHWGGRWDSNPQQPESQSGTLPLSYGHHYISTGLPDWTRTSDPQLRRLMLYPPELRAVRFLMSGRASAHPGRGGRGEWTRTTDPLRPRQVRYQAALRPDRGDDTGGRIGRQTTPPGGSPGYAASRWRTLSPATRWAGSLAENVLPWPGCDLMSRVPWCRSSTCLTIASPRPVPPVSRDRLLSTR